MSSTFPCLCDRTEKLDEEEIDYASSREDSSQTGDDFRSKNFRVIVLVLGVFSPVFKNGALYRTSDLGGIVIL